MRGAMMASRMGQGGSSGKEIRKELGLSSTTATFTDFMSILWPYFWPKSKCERVSTLLCFTFLGLSKATNIVAPVFLGLGTDKLVNGTVPIFELLAFAILRFLTSVFDESQRLVYLRVKEVAGHEVSCRTFMHLHSLSYSWHVSKRTGVVLKCMDRGTSSASTVVEMLVLRLIPTIIEAIILACLFALNYGSPGASIVLAVSFIGYFIATYILTQWRTKIRARANVADNDASAIANDSLTGFEVVKASGAENYELHRYSEAVKRFQEATRQTQGSLVTLNITQAFIMRAAVAGILIVTAYDVVEGRATIGDFVALQTWIIQLFQPLSWLGSLYTMIIGAMTDMGNLAALLKEEPAVKDIPNAKLLTLTNPSKGARVEFSMVSFQYPHVRDRIEAQMDHVRRNHREQTTVWGRIQNWFRSRRETGTDQSTVNGTHSFSSSTIDLPNRNISNVSNIAITVNPDTSSISSPPSVASPTPVNEDRPVLQNISFTIDAGKTLAVVGSTGSGKSTLSRLLFRYYDVNSGNVHIDGQNIREVTQNSLRAAIGIVPQDAVLFNESLRYNIAYGRPDATEEEIINAAKNAQIWDFVSKLKEGLATKVGERGLKLSGGEKQRVAIARTLLKNPPILILDEATSALDSITETEVQKAISNAAAGRTVLTIAHRLSTIRDADEILVLENGNVVERGTHEQLLAIGNEGRYYQLWNQQANMNVNSTTTNGPVDSVTTENPLDSNKEAKVSITQKN